VPIDELLERADAARASGRMPEAAGLYEQAIARCRADGDLVRWTRAVLGAASGYVFGAEPGRLPAELYDVLVRTTDDADRARLAAALARCWVYAGQAARAVPFADEAVDRAQRVGRPALLADSLDAALAARWGPDDLDARVELAGRLDDVTAHVLDPDTRLQSHLWGLQVACESLDLQVVHRHMRALEGLGEESPRAQFFAASRRLMLDLVRGRTDTAPRLIELAVTASERAGLADAWMVVEAMKGYAAVQADDPETCAVVAAECEEFATAEGVPVVSAEAGFLWLAAGAPDRARALVRTFHGRVLDRLPRDVNWLLTLQCVLETALGTGDIETIERAAHLLTPYAGRAVFNAGAVMFHGVTDDTLSRAAVVLDDADAAAPLRAAALATYERIGARWWRDRLAASHPPRGDVHPGRPVALRPVADGLWLVGPADATVTVRPLRGFGYLRELLRRPGRSVSALDLVTGGSGAVRQPGLGEVLDDRAREAYRRRLADIERDLTEAEEWSDLGRFDALHAERDALVGELAAATGFGGRARLTGSSHERARVAATKAITAAIDRLATIDAPLGRHLRATIRTGLHCSYQPDPDDTRDWILDERPRPPR
jgi:hypothetical protein